MTRVHGDRDRHKETNKQANKQAMQTWSIPCTNRGFWMIPIHQTHTTLTIYHPHINVWPALRWRRIIVRVMISFGRGRGVVVTVVIVVVVVVVTSGK